MAIKLGEFNTIHFLRIFGDEMMGSGLRNFGIVSESYRDYFLLFSFFFSFLGRRNLGRELLT